MGRKKQDPLFAAPGADEASTCCRSLGASQTFIALGLLAAEAWGVANIRTGGPSVLFIFVGITDGRADGAPGCR